VCEGDKRLLQWWNQLAERRTDHETDNSGEVHEHRIEEVLTIDFSVSLTRIGVMEMGV